MTATGLPISDISTGAHLPNASLFALKPHGRRTGTQVARQQVEMIAAVNHAVRTPLASVIGYAEVLLSGEAGELSAEQKSMILRMGLNGMRLRELVEEFGRTTPLCLALDHTTGLEELLTRVITRRA